MKRPESHRGGPLFGALIVGVLLVAQVTALTHLDLDGHSRDSLCAICHAATELGAASVADLPLLLPTQHSPFELDHSPVLSGSGVRKARFARAPPVAS